MNTILFEKLIKKTFPKNERTYLNDPVLRELFDKTYELFLSTQKLEPLNHVKGLPKIGTVLTIKEEVLSVQKIELEEQSSGKKIILTLENPVGEKVDHCDLKVLFQHKKD